MEQRIFHDEAAGSQHGVTRKQFLISSVALATTLFDAKARALPLVDVQPPSHDGSIIRPYNNAWLYTARNKEGEVRPQGVWSDHLQFREIDKRKAMIRVQGMTYLNGASSSVLNAFDPITMGPIMSQTRGPDGRSIKRSFADGKVRSTNQASPAAPEIVSEFAVPPYTYDFYGGMYGLLLISFPMHDGATGRFETVEEFDDAVVTASYEVMGSEKVSAGSRGTINAWRVQSNREGHSKMTFWLSHDPPHIIKLEMVNEGSPLVMSFDMI